MRHKGEGAEGFGTPPREAVLDPLSFSYKLGHLYSICIQGKDGGSSGPMPLFTPPPAGFRGMIGFPLFFEPAELTSLQVGLRVHICKLA